MHFLEEYAVPFQSVGFVDVSCFLCCREESADVCTVFICNMGRTRTERFGPPAAV